eukprot:COSAG04_NODE_1090_length_8317_cov_6.030001_5_plen_155_part_01
MDQRQLDGAARRLLHSTGEVARVARAQAELEQRQGNTLEAVQLLNERLEELENRPAASARDVEGLLGDVRAELRELAAGQAQLQAEKEAAVKLWHHLQEEQRRQQEAQAEFREQAAAVTRRLGSLEGELARQARVQREDQQLLRELADERARVRA